MKKKWLALLLAAGLVLSLAACTGEKPTPTPSAVPTPSTEVSAQPETDPPSTDPLEMITEGYYQHSFTVEGYGEFCHYFHFYEEDPVLGAVFFAGLNNNRSTFVGTYTVEETPFDYACFPDRATKEDSTKEATEGTAPYTVTFFDWDGNQIGQVGFDGDILYNVMDEEDTIYAQGSGTVNYLHDTAGEKASYYEAELGVPYLEYVADDEATSTLQICHNKTYVDLVGAMIEGTWAVAENADGGLDFTLTPNDSTDTGAVVSTSADKATCTYTPDGGAAVAMSSANATVEAVYTFTGKHTIAAYNMEADVVLELYGDNTCKATMSLQGSSIDLAAGTYELNGYKFHFTFDNGTEADSNVDGSGTMTVQLVVAGTQVGDVDSTLTLVKDGPQLAYTFTGTYTIAAYNMDADVVMELYDDNTCKATMSVKDSAMDLAAGTYELKDGYKFHFNFDNGTEADSNVDSSGTMTVQLVVAGTQVGDVDTTLTLQK